MNLFIPIILIIIALGTFFTFIDPNYQNIKNLKEVKSSYTDMEKKVSEIRKSRNRLAETVAALESAGNLERLNKLLPNHINNIELIVDIDRIAKNDSIRISDITLQESSKNNKNNENSGIIEVSSGKEYQSSELSFSFVTRYDNFKNFIDNLRKSLRLLDVVSLDRTYLLK